VVVNSVRSTASSLLTTSPAKVRWERDNPLTYKGVPLIMGGCFHSMVLEPECLDVEYAVKPKEIDGKSPLDQALQGGVCGNANGATRCSVA
jgi:hypothetical protein